MVIDYKKRADDMHRRAQAAEGELMRMKEAHKWALTCFHRPEKPNDYYLYGYYLLNNNKSLFPKDVK